MDAHPFNLEKYLQRIRYRPSTLDATLECLTKLHTAQLHTIPFENLDIHLGMDIELAPEKLVQKLIHAERGGYCFELNGLFLIALHGIGFRARPLLGRVHISGEATGRGHQVSLVSIQEKDWIVDVGFGADTPRRPVPLELNVAVTTPHQTVRIIESQEFGYMVQRLDGAEWKDLYSFDLEHVCPGDIEYGNYYTSTSPSSIFTASRIVVLPTPNGILSLFDNTLKEKISEEEKTIQVDENNYLNVLETKFGIRLTQGWARH